LSDLIFLVLNRSYSASGKRFRVRYMLSEIVSELSDEKASPQDKHPVFAESRSGSAGGSNPTPGANKTLQVALSAIIAHAFWMKKEGYRLPTIRSCVNTLKAVSRKADLLNPEAVKIHHAATDISISRKEKICQDLARFYKFKQIPLGLCNSKMCGMGCLG